MPVYPQLIHGVHHVPGMIPTHLNHPVLPHSQVQPVHILPPQSTIITTSQVPEEETTIDEGDLNI